MDFLNQIDNDNKNDTSIFSFNDKSENKNNSLPFPFSSQSSVGGVNDNNMFLNDMKSQSGETFNLNQFESDNKNAINNNNNFGGFDFLNTICEVPESSNNIFSSQNDGFLTSNLGPNPEGLDFINEEENEDNNNFDFSKFQNNNNDEPINVDINNLFKSSKTKKNENFEINNILNMTNNKNEKNDEIPDKQIISNINDNRNNESKDTINIDINNSLNNDNNNNKINSIQNINNNLPFNQMSTNKLNPPLNAIPNKEKTINNSNNNTKITPSSISGPSKPLMNNINYNIKDNKDNKENIPSFANITIKPTLNKQQKINLDDIDQIISLNEKEEIRPNPNTNSNINISNLSNNSFPINQNFLKDNNKIDKVKDNLKFLSNEISNMFNSSINNGKRTELEPKDKDLQNFENLLNFTKENITSKSKPKKNPTISSKDKNINQYKQINTSEKYLVNNTQKSTPVLKQLPPDSFDKKCQLIKISKNDMATLQNENYIKTTKEDEKNSAPPSKLEMIQKYNELASRLNKIREKAKEYRNFGNYFSQLISANENYNVIYPNMLKKMLEEYNKQTNKLLCLMKIKNNKMSEMNNEFFEEVKKYSLAFSEKI